VLPIGLLFFISVIEPFFVIYEVCHCTLRKIFSYLLCYPYSYYANNPKRLPNLDIVHFFLEHKEKCKTCEMRLDRAARKQNGMSIHNGSSHWVWSYFRFLKEISFKEKYKNTH
jgi:hypothetical protein